MIKIESNIQDLSIKLRQLATLKIGRIADYKASLLVPVQQVVTSNFTSQKSGDGRAWAKLADSTIAQKQRLNFPTTALVRTGTLENAVKNLSVEEEDDGSTLLFGIDDEKIARIAGYQQIGTKTIPSRPFLVLNVRLSEIVVRLVLEKEINKIKQAFTT